nr:MAG TPA: hypothetical protein [Caudoviricetes sp.]
MILLILLIIFIIKQFKSIKVYVNIFTLKNL